MSHKTLSSVGSVRLSAIAEKSPFLATVDLQVPADVPNASLQQKTSFLPPISSTLRALDGGAVMRRKSLSDKPFEEKGDTLCPLPMLKSPIMMRSPMPDFRRSKSSDIGFLSTARSLPLPSEGESPLLARMSTTSLSASPLRTASLSAVAPSMNPGRKSIGPGGVPPSNQKDFYRPREDEIINIAKTLGMTSNGRRKLESLSGVSPSPLSKSSAAPPGSPQTVVPLGIKLSDLLRFAVTSRDQDMQTVDIAKRVIAPMTSAARCCYVDTLEEDMVRSNPDAYIIYSSRQPFHIVMAHIQQYFEMQGLRPSQVFVWMDVFCSNLHRDSPIGPTDLAMTNQIIVSCRKVILMLDRAGTVLTRTWALYELWQASLSERPDKLVVLPTSWAWQDMVYPYVAMDFARSECRKEADRPLLLREIQKANDSSAPIQKMKDALITGAKREMFRSEILVVGGSPMKVLHAATAYALMLYLDSRFTDAEDILMGVLPKMEKTGAGFNRHAETELMFQLALVARGKGTSSRTEAYLQSCLRDGRAEDVGEELYYEAMLMYVRHLFEHQEFTKAELLCRKMMDMVDDDSRMPVNLLQRFRARARIQLASLSVAQRLAKEAEERIKEALNIGIQLETADGLIAASCYKILSECARLSPVERGRDEDLMRRSMSIRSRILGENHPETLDLKCYEAQVLAEEHKLAQAEALFQDVYRVRQQLLGSNHVSTIQALINIADLQRQQRKYKEAEASEDRLLTVGSVLLKHCRADVLQNFSLVVTFMETREHLLKKASPFITRAFIVFKEKFGREAEATKNTQKVLEEILAKERQQAADALGEAELNGSMEKYQTAEVFFRLAVTVAKQLFPNENHVSLIQGWANALYGLGRDDDAKDILRAAGLARKSMQQALPLTYQKWMKPRVAKYMDERAEKEAASVKATASHSAAKAAGFIK